MLEAVRLFYPKAELTLMSGATVRIEKQKGKQKYHGLEFSLLLL